MVNTGAKIGAGLVCAAAVALLSGGAGLAQGKQWSDESVQCVMSYAWSLTPPTYTGPDGKTIVVNKNKRKDVVVPLDTGREAVRVARVSAYAEVCGLPEEQRANYRTFMRREDAKKRWSEQQLLYISQLHLTTILLLTGKLEMIDKDTGKKGSSEQPIQLCEGVQIKQKPASKTSTCTEGEREKVRALINAYINTAPEPSAKAAGPVKAGTQKK